MYHVIQQAPPGTSLPGLWVPPGEFKREVEGLAARGYHAVTLQQVWDAWHHGGLLPSKPIVFSFDDGHASQYRNALPILRARGWPGVLNLEVATLHTTLRPRQVRALVRSGWEVDAHTMTHPDLTKTYGARLRYEVATSRSWIRKALRGSGRLLLLSGGPLRRRRDHGREGRRVPGRHPDQRRYRGLI